jgi:gamma-glutamyltranspeptidase/glutathione hydrolase
VLDWRLEPQAAVSLPNFGGRGASVELERDTPVAALAPRLAALGHRVSILEQTSGTHVIVRAAAGWRGGADPRREGVALGD